MLVSCQIIRFSYLRTSYYNVLRKFQYSQDSPMETCDQDDIHDKLIYSTEKDIVRTVRRGKFWLLSKRQEAYIRKNNEKNRIRDIANNECNIPIALKYLYGSTTIVQQETDQSSLDDESNKEKSPAKAVYPFNIFMDRIPNLHKNKRPWSSDLESSSIDNDEFEVLTDNLEPKHARDLLSEDDMFRYGTADPLEPGSNIPCGGCGAHLHCQDNKMPGFVPTEIFQGKKDDELRRINCQRCYIMREYNIALKVSVSPDFYPQTLSRLADKQAIVLLIVDLTDFPGSVWPDIINVLGHDKRIILVGNKVDLLPQDCKQYLANIHKSMRKIFIEKCLKKEGVEEILSQQLIDSILVSARTGYNVEALINKVYTSWQPGRPYLGGDVYLIGTTNVGKSSLFNLLLDSDMCKVCALDRVARANISAVPGTTLNLLRFPIMRPDAAMMNERLSRLRRDRKVYTEEELKRLELLRSTRHRKYAILRQNVGNTFLYRADKKPFTAINEVGDISAFRYDPGKMSKSSFDPLPPQLDPGSPEFADGKWCYDTPGTVSTDQIINLLTQDEIRDTLNELPIQPRTFLLRIGESIFVGGLGRIDILSKSESKISSQHRHPLRITVFCSDTMPINILNTVDANEFYAAALGTNLLRVPRGSTLRLAEFPALASTKMLVRGKRKNESSCDIVLSSVGWVAMTPKEGETYSINVWTPDGKGAFLRVPAFCPNAVHLRGKRIQGTSAYRSDGCYIPPS